MERIDRQMPWTNATTTTKNEKWEIIDLDEEEMKKEKKSSPLNSNRSDEMAEMEIKRTREKTPKKLNEEKSKTP